MTDNGKTYSDLDAELRLRELERAVVEAAKWYCEALDTAALCSRGKDCTCNEEKAASIKALFAAVRALDAAEAK